MTPKLTDEEILAHARELDASYARAEAFDREQAAKAGPQKEVWRINWDNGANACGTFPWTFATEDEAGRVAEDIEASNRAEGIWDEDGCCEVISELVPAEGDEGAEPSDEMGELRKAALNRGQP